MPGGPSPASPTALTPPATTTAFGTPSLSRLLSWLPVRFPARLTARDARRLEGAAVTALLLVASYLRLAHLDLVQYRDDDDELWNIVTRMAHTGQVPLTGMHSSLGLPNGPFQALLLAPLGWAGASPPLMTAGIGLLNVLAVTLVYGFARDFFGRRVALLALLLVALNPWAVVLSRRLWGDDLVAPFAVLALWMLCRWLFRNDGRALLLAAAALAIVCQVYIVGMECLAPALVATLLARTRLRSRWVLGGVTIFALLVAPYTVGAALPRLQALQHVDTLPGQPPTLDAASATFALLLASNEGYQSFALQAGSHLDATGGLPGALGLLARGWYLLGLAIGLWTVVRGPGRLRDAPRGVYLLLLVTVAVPVLALVRHAAPVYPYYLIATFPAPFLFGAIAVDRLWSWSGRPRAPLSALGRIGLGGLVTLLTAVQLALAAVFFAVIGQYWPASIYGMPWAMTDHLVQETQQLQRQYGATRVFVPSHTQEQNVIDRLLVQRGTDAVELDDQHTLVLPGQPALYLAIGDAPAQQRLAASYGQYLVYEERLPGAGAMARFYFFPPAAALAPLPDGSAAVGWTFSDASQTLARLDGVLLPRRALPGHLLEVTTYVTALTQPGPGVPDFSIFAHLLRPDGQAIAGQDDPAWPSHDWRPGDRIVEWLDVAIPASATPGIYVSDVGLYSVGTPDHPGVNPLSRHDRAGRPLSSGIGPATVIAPSPPAPPQRPLSISFAGGIDLDGYDLAVASDQLTVTLHWTALVSVPRDYTVYVHVLDGSGKLVAQNDAQPDSGLFPTSFWRPGDRVADVHRIALPARLPSGAYRLELGLYELQTLQRVAVTAGEPVITVTLP